MALFALPFSGAWVTCTPRLGAGALSPDFADDSFCGSPSSLSSLSSSGGGPTNGHPEDFLRFAVVEQFELIDGETANRLAAQRIALKQMTREGLNP